MSKIDDKSGYDHVLLDEDSRQFFGFQWQGWYLVNATLHLAGKYLHLFTKQSGWV